MIKNHNNFASGMLFVAVGAVFALSSTRYAIGEASDMGPGYFPLLVSVLAIVVGLALVGTSLGRTVEAAGQLTPLSVRPLVSVLSAVLLFGILMGGIPAIGLPPMGLFVAVFALVLVASLAGKDFRLKEVVIVATILSIASYLLFVRLLGVSMPTWPGMTA